MNSLLLDQIVNGRTDLVFEYLSQGHQASEVDPGGVSLLQWCAYYGDVSAIRFLLSRGAPLASQGENLDLNGAAFHGHWQLCQFLLEHGADANRPLPDSGETPLHAALCTPDRQAHDLVIRVLLAHGANPNSVTLASAETGGFMRDCRTKAETPLHRAAAFGTEDTLQILLEAGADREARDMNGDSPLSWASWYARPDSILRLLCFGEFSIRPGRRSLAAYLRGEPQV